MKKAEHLDCSRCTRGHGELFSCYRKSFVFDIDEARKYTSDGRQSVELDVPDVAYSVNRCLINSGHLAHVDVSIPGIVAHVFMPTDEGTVVHGHRLIDGHHRAARCLEMGIPFRAFLLSERESVKCLYKAPEAARLEFPELATAAH